MNIDTLNILNSLPDDLAIVTKIWGPPTWFFLHSMAMAYPKKIDNTNSRHIEIKQNMYNFLNSLGSVLPCPICGESYSYYITQKDFEIWPNLESREKLTYYIYKIHNKVNEKLGVPNDKIPSFKDVLEFYSTFISGNPCIATTEIEKELKRKQGCKDTDFKQYKSIVKILDTDNNIKKLNSKKISNNKENFENKENLKENLKFSFDIWHLLLILIIIILIFYLINLKVN